MANPVLLPLQPRRRARRNVAMPRIETHKEAMLSRRGTSASNAHVTGIGALWLFAIVIIIVNAVPPCLGESSVVVSEGGGAAAPPEVEKEKKEYEPGVFYQDARGYLCLDGTCYDGSHQDAVVRRQLYKRHACVDLREYCRNVTDLQCSTSLQHQAHCPQSCRVCHNRTRTAPVKGRDEEADVDNDGNSENQNDAAGTEPESSTATATATGTPGDNGNTSTRPPASGLPSTSSPPPATFGTPTATTTTPATTAKKKRRWSKYRADIAAVLPAIGSDLGVPQIVTDRSLGPKVEQALEDARYYVQNTVDVDDQYWTVRDKCRNRHHLCAQNFVQGKCGLYDEDDANVDADTATFMQHHCAPMCQTCEQLHYLARCPVDMNQKNAWFPGDLDAMFERILNDPDYQQYHNVTVLSRPRIHNESEVADGANVTTSTDNDDDGAPLDGPWLMILENFTSPEEAERLIELGGVLGYERSEDVGDEDETGEVDSVVSVGRTSTNAWCDVEKCENDPAVRPLIERMERLTGIPRVYTEHLQLLRYEVGQFYEEHHDYIEIDRLRYAGVRILTVFLYLNTVEEGGETNFPLLGPSGLSVHPRQGRVVLWPSVLNDDPHLKDDRTNHQAMPVLKGIKYGANAWYHQRHIRTGFDIGC